MFFSPICLNNSSFFWCDLIFLLCCLNTEYALPLSTSVANMKKATWNRKYVQDALVSSVELLELPPQIIVRLGAKYFVLVVRLLPMWAQVKILTLLSLKAVPSCMKQDG